MQMLINITLCTVTCVTRAYFYQTFYDRNLRSFNAGYVIFKTEKLFFYLYNDLPYFVVALIKVEKSILESSPVLTSLYY